MQIIKDLIPFHNETIGSERIRKFLGLALIVGLLQTFSWTYQVIEAPQAKAAQQYNPADATTLTIPSGVDTVTFTVIGGGGGQNGTDCGSGCTTYNPSNRGQVTGTLKVSAGDLLGIFPGNAGTNGVGGANSGGGTGGSDTYASGNYNGGNGGNAGKDGSSGGGGGGGGASILTLNSTIFAIAGGSGGAGGSANYANSGQAGISNNSVTSGFTYGGVGKQTVDTTVVALDTVGTGKNCTVATNDGGGGGGGGGGYTGGAGGDLTNAGTGECSGLGRYLGSNYLITDSKLTSTTNGTNSSSNTSNGSIQITYLLSTPNGISATATLNTYGSITVSWATASGASSFLVKLYDTSGNTLLASKSVAGGTYSTNISGSDYSNIANGVNYKVSITSIGNGSLTTDSTESSKYSVTTNAPAGATSDTDTAISLDGTSSNHLYATDNSGVRIPDTFTAEAWIYPTSFACKGGPATPWNNDDGYCHIVSKGGYFSIITATTTNSTDAGVSAGQLGFNWGGVKFSKYVLNLNEWHHVAFSREGGGSGQAKLYVDGNLVLTDTATTNSFNSTRDFTIGATRSDSADSNSIYGKFIGQIDEVKLSNRFRSREEIQYDLHHHNVSDSSFKFYYDFNENSGTKVFNRITGSASATDLTINGSASFDTKKIYEIDTTTATAYTVVKFYRDYLVNANGWTTPSNINSVRYLVVGGGGGGGGGWNGGGGGAGGYRETNTTLRANTVYNIEIGIGGLGALYTFSPTTGGGSTIRNNSVSSESITANGGGSGGTEQNVVGGAITGATSGGSGGGGVHAGGVAPGSGNSGGFNPVEGFAGGSGASLTGVYAGGGGGGAGGVGGDATANTNGVPGNGGTGVTTYITGNAISLAGGGAGAGRFAPSVTYAKHGSATHGGGTGSCADQCTSNDTGTAGTKNTGGGGGAGAAAASGAAIGGSGGSGFIVIKYITNKPTIITQPVSDTSTVGAVDTFTISTSVPPSPLTKSVKWQYSADTTTVSDSARTGWTDVSTGAGYTTDTFTTSALTKSMNKYRYRAIVTFSDTATITSVETSTVATLTVNDSITITSDTSTITRKYGYTQTVRTINYTGGTTSTGSIGTSNSHAVNTPYGALANGKIYVDTTTSTAKFYVDTGTVIGTYYETITVTDYKGAVSSYTQQIIVNPADTLTVQADTLTSITYNPNGMTINPTASYSGLVASDTASAITLSFSATGANCANGGSCSLGDTGPGGGTVFKVSGSTYFESAPKTWYSTVTYNGGSFANSNVVYCANASNVKIDPYNPPLNTSNTSWGGGKENTDAFRAYCAKGAVGLVGTFTGGGKTDWYIPNATEMNGLVSYWSGIGQLSTQFASISNGSFWTSDASYNATWGWLLTQPYFNGSGNWFTAGAAYNHQGGLILPIRTFTSDGNAQQALASTTSAPTNAGTYTITPSALSLANGVSNSNYVNVVYQSSTFVINKATQDSLTITSKLGSYNGGTSSMKLTTVGGSDTGTVTYSIVTGGSASGCSMSSNVLSFTSAGTCKVIATKAATINYLVAYSETATITLSSFLNRQQTQTQSVPTQLPINGANSVETTTVSVPTVTSQLHQDAGMTIINGNFGYQPEGYTISGAGFTGAIKLTIGFVEIPSLSVTSDTEIYFLASDVAVSGPLFIECSDGRSGPTPFYFFTKHS